MAVPWVQIVQWVPSILEVSRQVLQEVRKRPATADLIATQELPEDLAGRIAALEKNERRLAELMNQMAEHTGQLTLAVTTLHRQLRWLIAGQIVLIAAVVAAFIFR